jgi:hypothetical protein
VNFKNSRKGRIGMIRTDREVVRRENRVKLRGLRRGLRG